MVLTGMKYFVDSIGLRFAWIPFRLGEDPDTSFVMYLPEACPWHTEAQRTGVCPSCHRTDSVIPILYGEPSDIGWTQIDRGELWSGGCVHDGYCEPRWYCKMEKQEF